MNERREHRRHEVWFPVEVDVEDGRAIAVSYDVSTGGMLMAAGGSVDVGTELVVTFRVLRDGPEKRVKGRVVRVDRNPASVDNRWRFKLALVFDEPQPEIEALLRGVSG